MDKKVCEVSEKLGFNIIETEVEFLNEGLEGRNMHV